MKTCSYIKYWIRRFKSRFLVPKLEEYTYYNSKDHPAIFKDYLINGCNRSYPASFKRWKDFYIYRGGDSHRKDGLDILLLFKNSGDGLAFDYGTKEETNYSDLIRQRNNIIGKLNYNGLPRKYSPKRSKTS